MLSIKTTMSLLVKVILILTLHQISLDSSILDEENVQRSLQYLCPGVDICNRNALNPNVNPNEVDERGFMSCCHGCSCYKDCHINMNCCFPSDREANLKNSISVVNINAPIARGNSSLISDQNSSLWNEDSASIDTNSPSHNSTNGTFGISRGIKTTNQEHVAIDNSNVSIDIELATKQCMYIKTGTADESWLGKVPAVRMVTSPPPGGCKSNTICAPLTQQNEQATCTSDDIFPWGDLFPVYSADYKLIFKNELCACCYGVMKYTPWLPMLECDTTNTDIPISEHFSFLQQPNKLSSYCTVTFKGVATPLFENTCFINSTETCEYGNYFPFLPDGINLTRSEIVKACNDGPDAPIAIMNTAYKNVFCAMCNVNVYVDKLQCLAGEDVNGGRGFSGKGIMYLFDTSFVKELSQSRQREKVFSNPIACLKNQDVWIEESCRTISCPSGQTRINGVCSFPSKRWMSQDGIELMINLKYVTSNTSVLRILRHVEAKTDTIVNALGKMSPWPSNWIITKVFHTRENNNFSPQLVILLHTKLSLPKKLIANIKTSLIRQWNIVLDGMGITFEQSLFKYNLVPGAAENEYKPRWLRFEDELKSFYNMSVIELLFFKSIFKKLDAPISFSLTKLVICEQITLAKSEYTIVAEGLILLNKLTNEIMFSLEFERVEDENGELVPRICLADSPLVLRRESNGASTVFVINLNLALAMSILKW